MMEGRPNFEIKAGSKFEKKIAGFVVNKSWEKGEKKLSNELNKTEEQKVAIDKVISLCRNELESMGLDFSPVNSNRVHLLASENFESELEKLGITSDALGSYNLKQGAIYVEDEKVKKSSYPFNWIIAHEVIHLYQKQKFEKDLLAFLPTSIENITATKAGYLSYQKNLSTKIDNGRKQFILNHHHFNGFNEAVTELTTKDVLARELPANTKWLKGESILRLSGYSGYIDIVKTIIKLVSERKGEAEDQVWQRIKKGQFTGEMMYLRNIEDSIGPGSLRILAAMGTKLIRPEIRGQIVEYSFLNEYFNLELSDPILEEKKLRLAKNLLTDAEFLDYKNHVSKMNKK